MGKRNRCLNEAVLLNSGHEIPILGIGTALSDAQAENEDHDGWDFELTDTEMAQMAGLDKNQRFASY